MAIYRSINLFRYYVLGFIQIVLLIFSCQVNASGSVNGFKYTTAVDSINKAISVTASKDGKNFKALLKPNPSSIKTALSARSLRGGAVGALLFLGTYYGITKTDDGTFERLANESEWVWCSTNPCSSSPSEIANKMIQDKNQSDMQFGFKWSLDRFEITSAGVLLVYGLKTAISNGYDYGSSLINSIGGSPNPNPPTAEIVSDEQVANAILFDAFAIEGSEYYPSEDQVRDARDSLLELYSTTAVGAKEADDTIKDISGLLVNSPPLSNATEIKDTAGSVTSVLPDFCSWATAVCDYFYSSSAPANDEIIPDVSLEDTSNDFSFTDFNLIKINWTPSCPTHTPVTVPLFNKTFDLQFDLFPLCEFMRLISSAIVALAYLSGAIIVATMGTARGES